MDIRKEFLDFFVSKNHELKQSAPLVLDDPTLLFVNAGMVQFKDIFTGKTPPPQNKTATSSQLCLRAGGKHNDLENVGYTARHHTLFEMLGNFSFGGYFKKEAISYAWEFITEHLKLDTNKLYVTVHNNDDEAYDIWKNIIQVDENKIKRFGDKDNFWSMGDVGPCGYCSEIFYDQGEEFFGSKEDYLGGDGDRFLEIWNLVFMQYEQHKDGSRSLLPNPSIDTGMGLERIVAIKEGVLNNYDSSLFMPLIGKMEQISNQKTNKQNIHSFRVISDHIRAISFVLDSGVLFGASGRGYVLRRILRRASRHGYLLGCKEPFLGELFDTLCEQMQNIYPSLKEKQSYIKEQIQNEEKRFCETISKGIMFFNQELENVGKDRVFDPKMAFKLYDTYGFPLDLTQDMLREQNITLDENAFNECMDEQKAKSSNSWNKKDSNDGDFNTLLEQFGVNSFVGYEHTNCKSPILAVLDESFKIINTNNNTNKSDSYWVMFKQTPFYAQGGGQVGDSGYFTFDDKKINVLDTKKFFDINLSLIQTDDILPLLECIKNKNDCSLHTNTTRQQEIRKHHSATHLLQSALKKVLGDNVSQAGSLNNEQKLRFDFTYDKALTKEQIAQVEEIVNELIYQNIQMQASNKSLDEAKKQGAIAMFGEKYDNDNVRVVSFGDSRDGSIELCGGLHIQNSGFIGGFKIISEKGVSLGVRRIEAVCGRAFMDMANENIQLVSTLQNENKTKDLQKYTSDLKQTNKQLQNTIKELQNTTSKELKSSTIDDNIVIIDEFDGDIKSKIDELKSKHQKVAVMLFGLRDKKMIVGGVRGIDNLSAKEWVNEICQFLDGRGGGRDDFASGGIKNDNKDKINEAKKLALNYAKKAIL